MTRWTHPPLTRLQRSHMWVLALMLSIMALSGCSRPTTLERIQQENALHLIIQNAPSVYYEGSEGPAGFEYELARLFAEHLGVELRVRTASDSD
ncbi:MAG: lytic transglycosylase F, partial [Gammaproteobacteria bacterium]|nr:lytic transglycosylase F [Gammaproteobacteria bacterium]